METADLPENINWPNLSVSQTSIKIRKFFIWLLVAIVLIVALATLLRLNAEAEKLDENFRTPETCPNTLSKTDAYEDYSEFKQKEGLMHCYCLKELVNDPYSYTDINFKDINPNEEEKICEKWFVNYSAKTLYKWGGPTIAVAINQFVEFLFKSFARWECHYTINDYTLYTWKKIFLVKFVNISIIALLANIKADFKILNDFGLLDGEYNELSPDWFRNVGGTLCYTLFLEIFFSPQKHIIKYFTTITKRWFDRRFRCDVKDKSDPTGEKVLTNKK